MMTYLLYTSVFFLVVLFFPGKLNWAHAPLSPGHNLGFMINFQSLFSWLQRDTFWKWFLSFAGGATDQITINPKSLIDEKEKAFLSITSRGIYVCFYGLEITVFLMNCVATDDLKGKPVESLE